MSRGTNQKLKLSILSRIMLEKTDDEHSVLVVEVAVSPQFFGWIFSLGNGVKVTAPETVVTQIRKYGERFMENYSGRGLVT